MAFNFHSTLSARQNKVITADKVLVVTGDSGTGGLIPALQALMPDWTIVNKGRGGATALQIKSMYSDTAFFTGYPTIIWDLSNDSLANNQVAYPAMRDAFARADNKILFVEPGVGGNLEAPGEIVTYQTLSQPATRLQFYTEPRDAVEAAVPNNFVPIYQDLLDGNDGSAGDLADVAEGIFPRSLRNTGDSVHLNSAGDAIVAAAIFTKMTADGW